MPSPRDPAASPARAWLQEGWVIANHVLVSFHVAFISSVLALPAGEVSRGEVLQFIFLSPETLVSAVFVYLTFHTGIAVHELGHFLTAARLEALDEAVLEGAREGLSRPLPGRLWWLAGLFLRAPYGTAPGIKREKLNYYPDAPYNLAVAAAGPRASRNLAWATLPLALGLLALGLLAGQPAAVYVGRLLLGLGVVGLLDFLHADPGKYAAFRERERAASDKAATVEELSGWSGQAGEARARMGAGRTQEVLHSRLGTIAAPWQFRNCGMGGRHTEKEYPESNISMQEAMFLILGAPDYLEAQELTVRLQNRLKEIIEGEEGCRVMGIGLEGGLAPYVDRGDYPLPEVRLWAMMKRAIEEVGCTPGRDVAIALDPAMSELEIAYRVEHDVPDSVGMYLFWRDKGQAVLDRDAVLEIYRRAMDEYEIPLLSIEDGFSEDDHQGWSLLLEALGESVWVIGDDLVTTNDRTIEEAADRRLINSALIKANQIGTLLETVLAMLVALGKGLELVVSHRSKSPNDDMEAQIALAVNALGLKAGGGANTERLIKYQAVTEIMLEVGEGADRGEVRGERGLVERIRAYEEPTNAGVPTVGATVELSLPESGVGLRFRGATPLGTSAGTGEAIHLTDATVEFAEYREVVERHPALFEDREPGVHAFSGDVDDARVQAAGDEALTRLYRRARRYGGKGCLNAVDNVSQVIAPYFQGRDVSSMTLRDVDRALLGLEVRTAQRRHKLGEDAADEALIAVMQRKQNLGMNAVLSVSLALNRALAHVRGKQLYELLREEAMAIVDALAAELGIAVRGSQWSDYVAALREAEGMLSSEGRSLYAALRELTGVYALDAPAPVTATAPLELHPHAVAEEPPPAEVAFGVDAALGPVRIQRLRDAAALLARANDTGSVDEGAYLVRGLVARLCTVGVSAFLGAKNLQPEIRELTAQLTTWLDGTMAARRPWLSRTLVRTLAGVVGRPGVIDRLWNDTVELAEVHLPGSALAHELRRAAHHALGQGTLHLARAYLAWLDGDETGELLRLGQGRPGPADEDARGRPGPRQVLGRIVEDLERLLGTADIAARLDEWRLAWDEALLRCEFGGSVLQELETLVEEGIQGRNRWVYAHHLRNLARKAEDFEGWPDLVGPLRVGLEALATYRPDGEGADPGAAERGAREALDAFVGGVRLELYEPVSLALDEVLAAWSHPEPLVVLQRLGPLREAVAAMRLGPGFPGHRYHLWRLDCLLEELGYLAARHLASAHDAGEPDLAECLEVIRHAARALDFSGLGSRELEDLAAMMGAPGREDDELLDVLRGLGRGYHRVLRRVLAPFEAQGPRLDLGEGEVGEVTSAVQRALLDLASLADFVDRATALVRHGHGVPTPRLDAGSPAAPAAVVHLGDRAEVDALVEVGPAGSLRDLYGNKGAGLLYISHLGLPTRAGFLVPAALTRGDDLEGVLEEHLATLEAGLDRRLGDPDAPLLLAVRGGAAPSLHGALDHVVFAGMSEAVVERLAKDEPWTAWDAYRRFLASYGRAVWRVEVEPYRSLEDARRRHGVAFAHELPPEAMREVARATAAALRNQGLDRELEADLAAPRRQLARAAAAVLASWGRDPARRMRTLAGLSHTWAVSLVVQEMALGNRLPGTEPARSSLAGVVTRTHRTDAGVRSLQGEVVIAASGGDLVAGAAAGEALLPLDDLARRLPAVHEQLARSVARLRRFMGTDQEVEFTVDRGVLSLLQTRAAETAGDRAVRTLADPGEPACRGIGVRGGGFRGLVAFDEADLRELASVDLRPGVDGVLMVVQAPTPADLPVILEAGGLLTARGGTSSHAAVAIHGLERPFAGVMSASGLRVHARRKEATVVDGSGAVLHRFRRGDVVSVDGATGEVFLGSRELSP